MLPSGLFGINNDGLDTAVKLLILVLVVVWLALVYYSYADARRRIADPMLVACATAASLFPFIGTIVYLIVRPPEYLDDVRERELEIAAAQARLSNLEHQHCPYCEAEVGQPGEAPRRRPRRTAAASAGPVPPRQPRPSGRQGGTSETAA